jgi:hypothetical protein
LVVVAEFVDELMCADDSEGERGAEHEDVLLGDQVEREVRPRAVCG